MLLPLIIYFIFGVFLNYQGAIAEEHRLLKGKEYLKIEW